MTKKLNFPFSGRLYLQTLKRLRIVGLAFLLVVAGADTIITLTGFGAGLLLFAANLTTLISAVVMPFCAFLFVFSRSQGDFYDSLPQSRTCSFFSMSAAALTWSWAAGLVSMGFNIAWCVRDTTMTAGTVAMMIVCIIVELFVIAQVTQVCMFISGTKTSAVLLFISAACCMMLLLWSVDTSIAPMISRITNFGIESLGILAPLGVTVLGIWDYKPEYNGFVACYAAVGAVIFALGVLAFIKRNSDIAQNSTAQSKQHCAGCILFSGVFIIGFAVSAVNGEWNIALLLAVWAVAAYFIYDVITKKSIKAIKQTAKKLPLLLCALLGCLAIAFCGRFLTYASIKTPAREDIESIAFEDLARYVKPDWSDLDNMTRLENKTVRGKEILDCVSESIDKTKNADMRYVRPQNEKRFKVTVNYKNGVSVVYSLWFSYEEINKLHYTASMEFYGNYIIN